MQSKQPTVTMPQNYLENNKKEASVKSGRLELLDCKVPSRGHVCVFFLQSINIQFEGAT